MKQIITRVNCGDVRNQEEDYAILQLPIPNVSNGSVQRIVKNATHISTDNPIQFRTEKSKPKEFTFRSAVLHHGYSPNSGHYTSVIKVGNKFISIDDTSIKPNIPTKLNTDGYVLVYRYTTLQSAETRNFCLCLSNSSCLDTLALISENSNFMSPQKRNIIERLQEYEIVKGSENSEDELVYLLRNVPTSGGILFVGEVPTPTISQ
ncbi:USP36_42 [Mytilus coruscus]|uniref:USP36_42 n=1 Tax=Mytilus coruscus TaxID=42192 RepID=A0A6J8A6M6_MYTCO|nr:USP36_42 [Mytilus coruscus]